MFIKFANFIAVFTMFVVSESFFHTNFTPRSGCVSALKMTSDNNELNENKDSLIKFILNENENNFNDKDDKIINNYNYPLAKEYFDFLTKYNINYNLQNNLNNKDDEYDSKNYIKYNFEFKSDKYVKIAKIREKNYRIFENNWNKLNNFDNNKYKLTVNKFFDTIDISSERTPPDIMNKPINKKLVLKKKNKLNLGFINNIKKNFFFSKNNNKKLNWLELGMTTPVKDQKSCGSCWAFSAVSALEAFMKINGYNVDRLSEQELVDCSKENFGCNGGLMDLAFDYINENNGLHSNEDYPYTAEDGECYSSCCGNKSNNVTNINLHKKKVKGSHIQSYKYTVPTSIEDIKNSLKNGPISIALDASSFIFRFYNSGVVDVEPDNTNYLNHAVLLIGYDTDEEGLYWIIQNSWGTDWGDNGLIKVRAKEGEGVFLCQIYGVYPTKSN